MEFEEKINDINILDILKKQKDLKLKGNLYHYSQILFAFNTNRIEGSKLSEEQTRYIYETGSIFVETGDFIEVNDIVETKNHFKLFDNMLENVYEELSHQIIKDFHKILKDGISDDEELINKGEYKKYPNIVGGIETIHPKDVEKEMEKLFLWYNSLENIDLKDIIEFHYRFEKIHPFQDGNGRVGRIIIFKECLKNNIVPFIILDKDKAFYYRGLKEYQNEKGYLTDTILNAQDQYIDLIEKCLI